MQIGNSGAATFAMRQAMQEPQLLLDLLRQTVAPTDSLASQPASQPAPPADGRGRLVDIRA